MARHPYYINGVADEQLTTAGLWFALTYLYAVNIDPKENRYLFAPTYQNRISAIRNCPECQLRSWAQYALQRQLKQSTNSGGVSIKEQQLFAQQLLALPYIKVL